MRQAAYLLTQCWIAPCVILRAHADKLSRFATLSRLVNISPAQEKAEEAQIQQELKEDFLRLDCMSLLRQLPSLDCMSFMNLHNHQLLSIGFVVRPRFSGPSSVTRLRMFLSTAGIAPRLNKSVSQSADWLRQLGPDMEVDKAGTKTHSCLCFLWGFGFLPSN